MEMQECVFKHTPWIELSRGHMINDVKSAVDWMIG